MGEKGMAMLTDFGQARFPAYPHPCFKTTHYQRSKGSYCWWARELALAMMEDEDIVFTKETDLWALGMVFYVSFIQCTRDMAE